jgi:hypothetical protein
LTISDTTSVSINGIHDLDQKIAQLSLDVAKVGADVVDVKDTLESSAKGMASLAFVGLSASLMYTLAHHRNKILSWLSPVDPSFNHEAACERREPKTGDWFLEGPELSSWKTSRSLLWINGNSKRFDLTAF